MSVFVGGSSGTSNTTGFANSFFGHSSGVTNTTGTGNSFFGFSAGEANVTSNYNSYFGFASGTNSTGGSNVFFGASAGELNTSGSENTFAGFVSGLSNTIGNFNATFGSHADVNGNITNATAIGYRALVGQSNSLVLGSINGINDATADTRVGIGTTAPSFRFHVKANGQDGIKIQHTGTGAFPQIRWTDSADVSKGSIAVDTGGSGSMNFFVNGADRLILNSNGLVRTPGGVFIANPNTLVITSPNGSCWGITVSDAGALATFSAPCP
jgi:hypothetical protein